MLKKVLVLEEHKYQLPCFMVAFSAQNNSIFKNYSLNMDSSTVTDQSLGATFNISNMAKKGKNVSYGQDLYSIYTSNSYQIEIEMMGCAQIQPLMYFQLVNVPMFRGAYMIYKIAHNILPGDMTTHITGMRISNKPVALVKEVYNYDDMFDGLEIDVYGNTASPEYQKTSSNAVVYTGDTPYRAGTGTDYIYGGKAAGRYKDIDYIDYEKLKNTKFSEHIHLIHAVKNALDNKKSDEHYLARCKVMPKLIYNNIKGVAAQYELIRKHIEEEYKGEIVVKYNSIWRCR
ncbi:MAG: hypothetical protein M0R03_07830, partial [Novosphingobium sp.]|nr:hypothetical protein [Novosphingobium sp.]